MTPLSLSTQLVADRVSIATGMDTHSIDAARLSSIIEARRNKLRLADELAYTAYLQAHEEELDALIDEVVIKETRFFRDAGVFQHLRSTLPNLAMQFSGTLRILSAPCGTGQEPYSLAALLRETGLPLERFAIDACDISLHALEVARKATYPQQAFRYLAPDLIHSLASREKSSWKIHEDLRRSVHFNRRNLAEPGAIAEGAYHLILCRNLFIYLHPEARATLAQSLSSALIPGGCLVLGSADRVEEISTVFAPLRPASSFAFVHRNHTPAPTQSPAEPTRQTSQRNAATPSGAKKISRPSRSSSSRTSVVAAPELQLNTVTELYQRALHHQQSGNLRSAERRCRQALYLAPGYLPALELLQSLWNHHPNQRLRHALTARILRTRAMQPSQAAHDKIT